MQYYTLGGAPKILSSKMEEISAARALHVICNDLLISFEVVHEALLI
jgi:hypothetical protein